MPSSDALTPPSIARKKTGATASESDPTLSPPDRLAYAAWMFVCLVWGTTYLAIRIAIETMPPFSMAGVRWIVAGALLLAVLAMKGASMPAIRAWPRLGLLGTLLIGVGNGG